MIIHCSWLIWPKIQAKLSLSRMFNANNISAKSSLCHIWLTDYSLTPTCHDRTDNLMFYRYNPLCVLYLIYEYSFKRNFQPQIGRKIRIFSLGRKNNSIISYPILIT